MTARAIPTRTGLLRRLVRAARMTWLRWQLACVRDERSHYTDLGMTGPLYQLNSWQQELALRARIRSLEQAA